MRLQYTKPQRDFLQRRLNNDPLLIGPLPNVPKRKVIAHRNGLGPSAKCHPNNTKLKPKRSWQRTLSIVLSLLLTLLAAAAFGNELQSAGAAAQLRQEYEGPVIREYAGSDLDFESAITDYALKIEQTPLQYQKPKSIPTQLDSYPANTQRTVRQLGSSYFADGVVANSAENVDRIAAVELSLQRLGSTFDYIYIILTALTIASLVGLVWFWFRWLLKKRRQAKVVICRTNALLHREQDASTHNASKENHKSQSQREGSLQLQGENPKDEAIQKNDPLIAIDNKDRPTIAEVIDCSSERCCNSNDAKIPEPNETLEKLFASINDLELPNTLRVSEEAWHTGLARHIGPVRESQQDYVIAFEVGDHFRVCILADGAGGHPLGEQASYQGVLGAAASIAPVLAAWQVSQEITLEQIARRAIEDASFAIATYAIAHGIPQQNSLRSTLIVLIANGNDFAWANLGDGGGWTVESQPFRVDSFLVPAKGAQPNHLLSSLGPQIDGEITSGTRPWKQVDYLLLGSDGVADVIDHDAFFNACHALCVHYDGNFSQAAEELLNLLVPSPVVHDNLSLGFVGRCRQPRQLNYQLSEPVAATIEEEKGSHV